MSLFVQVGPSLPAEHLHIDRPCCPRRSEGDAVVRFSPNSALRHRGLFPVACSPEAEFVSLPASLTLPLPFLMRMFASPCPALGQAPVFSCINPSKGAPLLPCPIGTVQTALFMSLIISLLFPSSSEAHVSC